MYMHTISAHVDDIVDRLDASSVHALKNTTEDQLARFHHGWGTSIRNQYGLWNEDHPLTRNWHQNPDGRKIIENCDFSEDHPDMVSFEIMKGVWKKVNA